MDIKDKIREKLTPNTPKKKKKVYSKWDKDTHKNLYKVDLFLRKSGYRLLDLIDTDGNKELIVESVKEDHLHPGITQNMETNRFEVLVKEHGLLDVSDLEEITKGYVTAIEVAKHLNELDLSKLIDAEEEDED